MESGLRRCGRDLALGWPNRSPLAWASGGILELICRTCSAERAYEVHPPRGLQRSCAASLRYFLPQKNFDGQFFSSPTIARHKRNSSGNSAVVGRKDGLQIRTICVASLPLILREIHTTINVLLHEFVTGPTQNYRGRICPPSFRSMGKVSKSAADGQCQIESVSSLRSDYALSPNVRSAEAVLINSCRSSVSKYSSIVRGGFFRLCRCDSAAAITAPGARSSRWRTN